MWISHPTPLPNSIFAIADSEELTKYCGLRGNLSSFSGLVTVECINEAIDEGDPLKTLECMQLATAKIRDIDPDNAQHYQDVLYHAKSQKLKVSLSKFISFTFTD